MTKMVFISQISYSEDTGDELIYDQVEVSPEDGSRGYWFNVNDGVVEPHYPHFDERHPKREPLRQIVENLPDLKEKVRLARVEMLKHEVLELQKKLQKRKDMFVAEMLKDFSAPIDPIP